MIVEKMFDQENGSIMVIDPKLFTNDRQSSSRIARNKERVLGAVITVEQWTHTQVDLSEDKNVIEHFSHLEMSIR